MPAARSTNLKPVLAFLMVLLVFKVTLSVVVSYCDYLPPNFKTDFLRGREEYFFGPYAWAFYAHILVGPVTLLLGLILISDRFRVRFPKWHRSLGKLQGILILTLLAPSGLWMARYAQPGGAIAVTGFSFLAVATAGCVLLGWRAALQRKFETHRRWMLRCFLLLCSAVVLRVIGGVATAIDYGGEWVYPLAAWVSWLVPLAGFELSFSVNRRLLRSRTLPKSHLAPSTAALSLPAMEISATLIGR